MSESGADARISTHRVIQLSQLADTAAANRVKYYSCAISASSINNSTMAREFTRRAMRWEQIRVKCFCRLYSTKESSND